VSPVRRSDPRKSAESVLTEKPLQVVHASHTRYRQKADATDSRGQQMGEVIEGMLGRVETKIVEMGRWE
jgi:hypothetical protein